MEANCFYVFLIFFFKLFYCRRSSKASASGCAAVKFNGLQLCKGIVRKKQTKNRNPGRINRKTGYFLWVICLLGGCITELIDMCVFVVVFKKH